MDQLTIYRNQIDNLDKEIIKLLWERFDIIKRVAEFKKENNISVLQSNRWQEVLEKAKSFWLEKELSPVFIWVIWNTIHEFAIELEEKIKNN